MAEAGTDLPLAISANCSVPPGRQHPHDLAEGLFFICAEVDHTIGNNHVGPAVFHRHILNQAFAEFDIAGIHRLGRGAGFRQHPLGHIDADHLAARPDLGCGDETVEAAPEQISTTFSPFSMVPNSNGLPTPAKDSTAATGRGSTTVS